MDREMSLGVGAGAAGADAEAFALPSRRAALDACRAAIEAGPVLITGEAGAGKTWLAGRLAAEAPAWRWAVVDLTPTTDAVDLLRAIAHRLGLPEPDSDPRLALADALRERDVDGRRWALVVDEAHLAPPEVLEEARVLSNRLGRPDGFAAMVLIGQTPLACRVETRPLAALEARLAARVHLRPIDADEAIELVARLRPGRAADVAEVERWHRDAAGNPKRLLRLASAPAPRAAHPRPIPAPAAADVEVESPLPSPPRLGSDRPPIHVEDGLIEVGWEAEPEPRPAPTTLTTAAPAVPAADEGAEVAVDDHYAALQAWNEWARNQGRALAPTAPDVATDPDPPADPARGSDAPNGHPHVWAEGQQSFAPYSQLFSRFRQPRDPD
jgi:type II secretory pathway predicted ATPase ExeA